MLIVVMHVTYGDHFINKTQLSGIRGLETKDGRGPAVIHGKSPFRAMGPCVWWSSYIYSARLSLYNIEQQFHTVLASMVKSDLSLIQKYPPWILDGFLAGDT